MKVLLSGSSGTVGQAVRTLLLQHGHAVRCLVRGPAARDGEVRWSPERGEVPIEPLEWADAVVSLNGAPLATLPWTERRRRLIVESRVAVTRLLAQAIGTARRAPQVWLSASATGVYGDRPGERLTESSVPGTGFLADVAAAWEDATGPAANATRVVLARTGVVLSSGAGLLVPVRRLAAVGLAGPIGGGRQHWPWISLGDEARAIVHLLAASDMSGPVNLASPVAATAGEVTRAVARALHRPHLVPAPAWALRAALGDAARDLLLADQRVVPARLVAEGAFRFEDLDLEEVVRSCL